MLLGNLPRFSLRLDVLRNRTATATQHFRSAITVSYYFCFRRRYCLSSMSSSINFATNERIIDHFWILVGSLRRFSLRLDVLRKRAAISQRCKNEAFNISERYCSRSHYFCFWTACCQGIKDTLSKFVSAVLVDVYNCLCLYRYFSR